MTRWAWQVFGLSLIGCCVLLGVTRFVATTWLEFNEWRGSSTWATTPSTSFVFNYRVSEVTYTYVVDSQAYTSQRVYFFEDVLYPPHDRDMAWLHTLEDDKVTIYYNPQHPQQAVLTPVVDSQRVVALFFGLMYGCGALLLPIIFIGLWRWWLQRTFSPL